MFYKSVTGGETYIHVHRGDLICKIPQKGAQSAKKKIYKNTNGPEESHEFPPKLAVNCTICSISTHLHVKDFYYNWLQWTKASLDFEFRVRNLNSFYALIE